MTVDPTYRGGGGVQGDLLIQGASDLDTPQETP